MWKNQGVVIKDAGLAIRKRKLLKTKQNTDKIEVPAMCYLISTLTAWKSILTM